MKSMYRRNMAACISCVLLVLTGCPKAEFRAEPTQGLAPLTVNFVNLSTPGLLPVLGATWAFGDGTSSEEYDPGHTYVSPGTYLVELNLDFPGFLFGTRHAYTSAFVSVFRHQIYLVKTDGDGNELWARTYGGDMAHCVIQTDDGGYALAGVRDAYTSDRQVGVTMYLVKTDAEGTETWAKAYSYNPGPVFLGPGSVIYRSMTKSYEGLVLPPTWELPIHELYGWLDPGWSIDPWFDLGGARARSVAQTSDGGYILGGACKGFRMVIPERGDSVGAMGGGMYAVKVDAQGKQEWAQTCGGSEACFVGEIPCRHYVLAGDMFCELDGQGNQVSTIRDFGGVHCAAPTDNGGYVLVFSGCSGYRLAGIPCLPPDHVVTCLLSVNAEGGPPAMTTCDFSAQMTPCSVVQTADGGYVLAGSVDSSEPASHGWQTNSSAGGTDMYLLKIDAAGNQVWAKTYGGGGEDVAYSVVQAADGGFVLAGSTQSYGAGGSDACLVKTDSQGNELWFKVYGGSNDEIAYSLIRTADGGFALAGYTDSFD